MGESADFTASIVKHPISSKRCEKTVIIIVHTLKLSLSHYARSEQSGTDSEQYLLLQII